MRLNELLLEMPRDIEDLTTHELNIEEENRLFYRRLLGKKYQYKIKLFELNDHASMYQLKSEFFVLDSNLKKVTYYMRYKVDNNGTLGQFVWQSLVWTDDLIQEDYLSGLPKRIFFEHLLPKFHTILTDSEQTFHGRRFWRQRIADAFNLRLNVYFFDFQGRVLKQLNSLSDLEKFQKEYDIWGPMKRHELKRMVITDKNLVK